MFEPETDEKREMPLEEGKGLGAEDLPPSKDPSPGQEPPSGQDLPPSKDPCAGQEPSPGQESPSSKDSPSYKEPPPGQEPQPNKEGRCSKGRGERKPATLITWLRKQEDKK